MEVGDLEALAVATYKRFRLDPGEPTSPVRLAQLLLKDPSPIELVSWLAVGNGATFRTNGRRRIAIRKGIPIEYALFALAHEISHVLLDEAGYSGPKLEASCDYLAACLLGPAPAAIRLHNAFGFDLREMARVTASTETWAALRLGEVLRVPLAAVQPRKVRYRGPREQLELFPDEETLRAYARGKARGPLRKVAIRDASGRAALLQTG
jgi:hypothetical protein